MNSKFVGQKKPQLSFKLQTTNPKLTLVDVNTNNNTTADRPLVIMVIIVSVL